MKKWTPEEEARLAALLATQTLVRSGYAGVNKSGTIVDRRLQPSAVPIPENRLLNVPKPKKLC